MNNAELQTDDRLLRVGQVAEICTFSVRKVWRDLAAKIFPEPIKLGPKTTRWRESDVRRFLDGDWKPAN